MWYFFTICSVTLSILSYRVTRSPKQSLHRDKLGLTKIYGNDAATLWWASLALLFIIINLVSSNPGSKELKENKFQSELTVQGALGKAFATQFIKSLKSGTQILLINSVEGEGDQRFHDTFVEGFTTVSKKKDISLIEEIVRFTQLVSIDEARIARELSMSVNQFDELVDKHPNCSSIISLIGIPADYEGSRTWIKVSNGDIRLGILSDDVFLLGGMIINNEINSCIVPKRRYSFDDTFSELHNTDVIFASRYHYISAGNIIEVMRRERRLFQVTRKI